MKAFLLIAVLVSVLMGQGQAKADEGIEALISDHGQNSKLFCALSNVSEAKRWVENQTNQYDKFKHCSVSCYLTLRCNATEVWMVGALKEFKDLFDDGNAEVADLRADEYGISLVTKGKAGYDAECARQCDAKYQLK